MERRDDVSVPARRWGLVALLGRCSLAVVAAILLLCLGAAAPAHAAAPAAPGACGVASTIAGSTGATKSRASSAHITLSTASAASGSQIVVHGTGWPAKAQVIIGIEHFVQTDGIVNAFDGVSGATVTAAGTFTAPTFTLPRAACGVLPRAGTVAQIVAHTLDGHTRVTAPLSIAQTPSITVPLASSTISIGTSAIPVNGSDWAPGSAVSLVAATMRPDCTPPTTYTYLQCLTLLPDARPVVAHAGADGRFASDAPIPPTVVPGTRVQVRADASALPYGKLVLQSDWAGLILPSTAPTLTLDRQTGPAGTTVAVSGYHWPSGKSVIVEYCRSEAVSQGPEGPECNQGSLGLVTTGYAQELGEAAVDASGHISSSVTLPSNARSGPVMIQVRVKIVDPADGIYSIYAQTASFTVTEAGPPQPAQATSPWWPFAVAGAVLVILLGLVLWRRGALRVRSAR